MVEAPVIEAIKCLVKNSFQLVILLSVPFILCFYWPNHEQRLMKYEAFQYVSILIIILSSLVEEKRRILNCWPALLLLLAVINIFTHFMTGNTQLSLSFFLLPVIAFYSIIQKVSTKTVDNLKKIIVVTCLINSILFIFESCGINIVFQAGQFTRPSGFMCYPATFALLCGISLFFAWEWNKWLTLPIGICLLISNEYSVILGVFLALAIPNWKKYWMVILEVLFVLTIILLWKHNTILEKLQLRTQFWIPLFKSCWSRPIDGWGLGAYTALPHNFFGFDRGNWSEVHNEYLDIFFSMGIIGCAWLYGFITSLKKYFTWNKYTQSLLIVSLACSFHSPLHFMDSLWLILVVYIMYQVELHEGIL